MMLGRDCWCGRQDTWDLVLALSTHDLRRVIEFPWALVSINEKVTQAMGELYILPREAKLESRQQIQGRPPHLPFLLPLGRAGFLGANPGSHTSPLLSRALCQLQNIAVIILKVLLIFPQGSCIFILL